MTFTNGYTPVPGLDEKDGANVTASGHFGEIDNGGYNNASFWRDVVNFNDSIWNLQDGSLPTLLNMPTP